MVQRKLLSDLLGYTFNRLTVIEYVGKGKWDKHYWRCRCECGGNITLNTSRITGADATKSCGCLRIEKLMENRADPTKHGLHKHPLYAIYHGMVQRCYNQRSQRYKYYGGRGIGISPEFGTFTMFYDWSMGNGWSDGLSIDRIDPNLGYSPYNCEWVNVSENSRRMNEHRRDEASTKG